jgi:hypothetical protein
MRQRSALGVRAVLTALDESFDTRVEGRNWPRGGALFEVDCHLRQHLLPIGLSKVDRLPGDMYSFESIPKTIDAHDALLTKGPMGQLLLFIGLWDLVVTAPAAMAAAKGEREPGGMYYVS